MIKSVSKTKKSFILYLSSVILIVCFQLDNTETLISLKFLVCQSCPITFEKSTLQQKDETPWDGVILTCEVFPLEVCFSYQQYVNRSNHFKVLSYIEVTISKFYLICR